MYAVHCTVNINYTNMVSQYKCQLIYLIYGLAVEIFRILLN